MELRTRYIEQIDYDACFEKMKRFTEQRDQNTVDELWFVEHPPVFTQGQAGKPEHLIDAKSIPVVQADRGGQITYHGPGQLVVYLLWDLKRLKIGVRELVEHIEQAIVKTLQHYNIAAYPNPDAHGVYVDIDGRAHKIASLGLRIRKGCSYHGLALNRDMDLTPFSQINPCGYQGMPMMDMQRLGATSDRKSLSEVLLKHLCEGQSFNQLLSFDKLPDNCEDKNDQ